MGSEPGSETSQRWRGPFGALLAPRSLVDPAQPARRGLIPATPAHCVVASSVSEAAECLPEYDGLNLASVRRPAARADHSAQPRSIPLPIFVHITTLVR